MLSSDRGVIVMMVDVNTLLSYKKISESKQNHLELLKDKTIILYTATLLENKNLEIVNVCLDILFNLIDNPKSHDVLLATFGLFESLESLSINARSYDGKIADRAAKILDMLRDSAPPAYGTRLRTNCKRNVRKTTMMYHLFISELTPFSRSSLDEALVTTKGMVSFVVDVQQQRCTIRIGSKISITSIVVKIFEGTGMKALVITKDRKTGQEVHVNVLKEQNITLPFDYIGEDESPPRKQALYKFTNNITKNAGGILRTAAELWNRSFYW